MQRQGVFWKRKLVTSN